MKRNERIKTVTTLIKLFMSSRQRYRQRRYIAELINGLTDYDLLNRFSNNEKCEQ